MSKKGKKIGVDLNDTDLWDDTLLIKAYEKSIKLAKEEVAKRIACSTNKSSTPKKDVSMDDDAEEEEKNLEWQPVTYKEGDYIRATYAEDRTDYEAKIISVEESTGKCLIRFIGYDNEQYTNMSNLIPSWGKKARKLQEQDAKLAKDENDVAEKTSSKPKKSKLKEQTIYDNYNDNSVSFPPPPPLPPMLMNNLSEDSEHLSAMLMAWYMSGYYTGLYEGHRLAKKQSKN